MADILTPLQDKFVNELMRNGYNGTQAYLVASPRASETTAARESHRLQNLPKITQEITKRSASLRERTTIDTDWLVTNYVNTFKAASQDSDWSGARQCLDSLAKLTGLMVDRRETTINGAIDHRLAAYTDDQLASVLAEISDRQPMLEIEGRVSEG
jgi:phage terminase small subunit